MEQRFAFRNTTFSLANDEANGCNVVGGWEMKRCQERWDFLGSIFTPRMLAESVVRLFGISWLTSIQRLGLSEFTGSSGSPKTTKTKLEKFRRLLLVMFHQL